MKHIDTQLSRDPRFVAATDRLNELKSELTACERKRDSVQSGIGTLASQRDIVATEAAALLSGHQADPTALRRDDLVRTLDELDHKTAVLRQAVDMQRGIVADLRAEIGTAIAIDLLPQHRENVAAVVEAALQLATALQAERELRDDLIENDVPFCGIVRPMALRGFDLRDGQSMLTRWLLEALEHGFVKAADLPDILHKHIPAKASRPSAPVTRRVAADGWLAA